MWVKSFTEIKEGTTDRRMGFKEGKDGASI